MAGRRSYVGKSLKFLLAVLLLGAFAGGLALQSATPGTAADLPVPGSAPTVSPAATASASPAAGPINMPSPTPTASPAETQPHAVEKVAVEAIAPLSVRLSEDRAFVGKPFEAELQVTGGTAPYTAAATDIPAGLVFDPATLSFSGTPTELYSPSLSVTVSDSSDPRQTLTEQIYIDIKSYYPPSVYVSDGELLPGMGTFDDGVVGWYYEEFLDYYGLDRAHSRISVVSGQLPPGLELRESSVAGVPTTPGTYGFTLHVQDRFGSSDRTSSIIVHALGMQTTGFDVPPAVLGEPYSARIAQATGGVAPYVYGYSTRRYFAGGLSSSDPWPEGLTVDANGFLTGIPTRVGSFRIAVWVRDADQLTQRIFWTTVTVLETRPPVVEQPPAEIPPAVVEAPAAPAPPAAVAPAGAVAATSGAELAETGLQSGSLNTTLWAAMGLLVVGAALTALNSTRRRRSSPV